MNALINIAESNKVIAEFMGMTKSINGLFTDFSSADITSRKTYKPSELKYESDWNLLMPVVAKIVKVCVDDSWNEQGVFFESQQYTDVLEAVPLAYIEEAYKVVLNFIDFYNTVSEDQE